MQPIQKSALATLPQKTNSTGLHRLGYWGLLLLAFALPFETVGKLNLFDGWLTASNLELLLYGLVLLAVASLLPPLLSFIKSFIHYELDYNNYFYRRRGFFAVWMALLLSCLVSSLLSKYVGEGLVWTGKLILYSFICLALPLWLTQIEHKIKALRRALLGGAVVAALVGLLEFVPAFNLAENLGWFKIKPTEAGGHLRLSGTFNYANVAAMYFEMVLPFAISGLAEALAVKPRQWLTIISWLSAISVLLTALSLTFCRGAWLGLAALFGMLIWLLWRKQVNIVSWAWALALTGALLALVTAISFWLLPLTALRLTSQSDQDWYQAKYSSNLPAVLPACQALKVTVSVTNQSPISWTASGERRYSLSYHWLYPSGEIAYFDVERVGLTGDLAPNNQQIIDIELYTPAQPGDYQLVWDMYQENVSWFSFKSGRYQVQPIQIVLSPDTPTNNKCQQFMAATKYPTPKRLPETRLQPDRALLWQAALNIIVARPLLGVGPDNFRLNYGAFSQPILTDWDTRILANNLVLEIVADLGLVGGGLLALLCIVISWPLILHLHQRQKLQVWQVAVIGGLAAFLGHGLVDYFWQSHAIAILFWLMLGLSSIIKPENNGGSKSV